MAKEAGELERMIVRLVGDSSSFNRMMDEAQERVGKFARDANRSQRKAARESGGKQHPESVESRRIRVKVKDQIAAEKELNKAAAERKKVGDDARKSLGAAASQVNAQRTKAQAASDKKAVNNTVAAAKKAGDLSVHYGKKAEEESANAKKKSVAAAASALKDYGKDQEKASKKNRESLNKARADINKDREAARKKQADAEQASLNRQTKVLTAQMEQRQKNATAYRKRQERADRAAEKLATRTAEREARRRARIDQRAHEQRLQRRTDTLMAGAGGFAAGNAGMAGMLGMIGREAVNEFAKFDLAMTESASIMENVTSDQMAGMTDAVRKLSMESKFAPDQLAKALYHLASAGLDAEQSVGSLPIVTKFATAGAFDLSKATDLLSTVTTSLGMRSKDAAENLAGFTKVADVLTHTARLAQGSVQEFSRGFTREFASELRFANKGIEEGAALLAVYHQMGLKGELASQKASMAFRYMMQTGLEHKEAQKELGIEFFNSSGQLKRMSEIAEMLEKRLNGLTTQQRAAVLLQAGFTARMRQSITPLIGNSAMLKEFEEKIKEAGGATETMANKQMTAFSNQMQVVRNHVSLLLIDIGEQLAPVMVLLGQAVKLGVKAWQAMPAPLRAAAVSFGVVAFAVGTLTAALVAAGIALTFATGGVNLLIMMGAVVFAAELAVLAGAFAAVVAAGASVPGVVDSIRKAMTDLWAWLSPVRKALASLAQTLYTIGQVAFDRLKDSAVAAFQALTDSASIDWDKVRSYAVTAIYAVEFALLNLEAVSALAMLGIQYQVIQLGNQLTYWLYDVPVHTVTSFISYAYAAFTEFWAWLPQLPGRAFSAVTEYAYSTFAAMFGWFSSMWESAAAGGIGGLTSAFEGVVSFLSGLWETWFAWLPTAWGYVFDVIGGVVVTAVQTALATVTAVWDSFFKWVVGLWTYTTENLGTILITGVKLYVGMVYTFWSTFFSWLQTYWGAIFSAVGTLLSAALSVWWKFFTTFWRTVAQVAYAIFTTFWSLVGKALVAAMQVWWTLFKAFWTGVGNLLVFLVGSAIDGVRALFTASLWKKIFVGIMEGLAYVLKGALGMFGTFFKAIYDGARRGKGPGEIAIELARSSGLFRKAVEETKEEIDKEGDAVDKVKEKTKKAGEEVKKGWLPDRQIGSLEGQFKKLLEGMGSEMGGNFQKFMEEKMKDFKALTPEKKQQVITELSKTGETGGQAFGGGMAKGIQKFDAALRFGAESASRIQDYLDRLSGMTSSKKKNKFSDLIPKRPGDAKLMSPKPPAEGGQNNAVENLLRQIDKNGKDLLKNKKIDVQLANI